MARVAREMVVKAGVNVDQLLVVALLHLLFSELSCKIDMMT